MPNKQMTDQAKEHPKTSQKPIGRSIPSGPLKAADKKAMNIGRKAGTLVAKQVERLHKVMDKEDVTKQDQLGIGGKIGTGLGIIGKHLGEKRGGLLATMLGGKDLVSEGRVAGAKAEKMVKRAVKTGVERIAGSKQDVKEDKQNGR